MFMYIVYVYYNMDSIGAINAYCSMNTSLILFCFVVEVDMTYGVILFLFSKRDN